MTRPSAQGGVDIERFHHHQFSAAGLATAKRGRQVSVCIPARDEERTLPAIVSVIRSRLMDQVGLVDEVVVADDHSADRTAAAAEAAGARVVPSPGKTDEGPGKGQALARAVHAARGDVLVFLDGDVRNFAAHFVVGLLGPVLTNERLALVKAFYQRPLDGAAHGGGRVTELLARPLLARLFPELGDVVQPLAGECAAPREVLNDVSLTDGYGVELGLLVDVARRFGVSSLAQVDLGVRVHRNRSLAELAPQAMVVLDTALTRAGLSLPEPSMVAGREPAPTQTTESTPAIRFGPTPSKVGGTRSDVGTRRENEDGTTQHREPG